MLNLLPLLSVSKQPLTQSSENEDLTVNYTAIWWQHPSFSAPWDGGYSPQFTYSLQMPSLVGDKINS